MHMRKKKFKITKLDTTNAKVTYVLDADDNNIVTLEFQTFIKFLTDNPDAAIKRIKRKIKESLFLRNKSIIKNYFNTVELPYVINILKTIDKRRFCLKIDLGCILSSNVSQIPSNELKKTIEDISQLITLFVFEDCEFYTFHLAEK